MTRFARALAFLALAAGLAAAALGADGGTTLTLAVDLRDTAHKVFRVRESIPAQPGTLGLLYPRWIPGEHGPTGPIENITGLSISAQGHPLAWHRDLVDMYHLEVEVPEGVHGVELSFEFLSPGPGRRFGGSVSATPALTVLEWNQVLFYPAPLPVRSILVAASVALPPDWHWASALETQGEVAPQAPAFAPVSVETLVDSPLAAGRYWRRIALTPAPAPTYLDLVADRAEDLAASDDKIAQQRLLVREAEALFGTHHYRHYDFLCVLTEQTEHFGLEHQESSDNRVSADFFLDPDSYLYHGSLMAHELVHSWNGKFRRPSDLLTPDFNTPMKGDLLWAYEGLTNYWGEVLAARSGARSPEQFREALAAAAAAMQYTRGRRWRPLQDTADAAQVLYDAPHSWSNWRRSVDFYDEGTLLWLDVDARIRERSHGRRALDDLARAFYGSDGELVPQPYTADELFAALAAVEPDDWAALLRARLDARAEAAPLEGIERVGWRLVYTDKPNAYAKAQEKVTRQIDLSSALGLSVDTGDTPGTITDVIWQSAAFDAGLAPAMRIVAVNGTQFSADILKDAITAAHGGAQALELLVQDFDQFRSVRIDYHEGLRYPHLERVPGTTDRLGEILHPRSR